jgi:2-dehydropantoate 2-reductase
MEPDGQVTAAGNENIYIVGNGVIGKALAVALSLNGKNVVLLRGSVDGQETFQQRIQVEAGNDPIEADITISSLSCFDKLNGLIVLANKSFGNELLARKLLSKSEQSPIVFLQNGLHVENSFIALGFTNLYRCVLLATSQTISESRVRFRLVAASPIGIVNGSEETLTSIVNHLTTPVFSFRSEPDIEPIIWKKVISNCVFNSICPLLETDNGVFKRNEAVLEIGKQVIRECITVARKSGIQLTEKEVLDNVLAISELSDGQRISTYQDILNNRQTEIDSMNLAIAIEAERLGIPVPITTLLGKLIKSKSEMRVRG